jgi:hypothetical protein
VGVEVCHNSIRVIRNRYRVSRNRRRVSRDRRQVSRDCGQVSRNASRVSRKALSQNFNWDSVVFLDFRGRFLEYCCWFWQFVDNYIRNG